MHQGAADSDCRGTKAALASNDAVESVNALGGEVDAVLVGGTAAAIHAAHRVSFDDDHVLTDLRDRFEQVLDALEEDPAWGTARVRAPVLILGRLEGVETGVRQLVRQRPLEIERVAVQGHALVVPTLEEMTRVKAWLILRRNATRDYLDTVALASRLGEGAAGVLADLDAYYEDQHGSGGRRLASQLVRQLADPRPFDLDPDELPRYRELVASLRSWTLVVRRCQDLSASILAELTR